MKLKAKVTFKEYLKLLYSLTYGKLVMKGIIGVALVLILWIAFYYLNIFNLPKPIIYQYITLFLIVVVQPIVIFTIIRRNYNSSNHLRESLEIELTNNKIMIRGESFYMEILWEKIFKLVEKENWFLIYQNNLSAIIIPKKDLLASEVNAIREILKDVQQLELKDKS